MKFILYSLLLSVMICSCKKEQKQSPLETGGTHHVTFNVLGFSEKLANFQTGSPALAAARARLSPRSSSPAANAGVIYYAVYDSNSNLLHTIRQDSTMTTFGQVADNLAADNYSEVIAAGHSDLLFSSNQVTMQQPDNVFNGYYQEPYFNDDAFYAKMNLTISGVDTTENVTLNRIVGLMTINIQDEIPANTPSLNVQITDYFSGGFNVLSGTPTVTALASLYAPIDLYTQTLTSADWGVINHKI